MLALIRAVMLDDVIGLYFNEPFKADLDVSLSRFEICHGNKRVKINSLSADPPNGKVEIDIRKSDLQLDKFGRLNEYPLVSYFDSPGDQDTSVIETIDGVDLGSFTKKEIIEQTGMSMDARPHIISNQEVITLASSRGLDLTSIPLKSMFELKVNGEIRDIEKITPSKTDNEFYLEMKTPVTETDLIHLSYTPKWGDQENNNLQDTYGNDMGSFELFEVDNQAASQSTEGSSTSRNGPMLINQYIEGQKIRLVFDDLISPNKLRKSLFSAFLDGELIKIRRPRVRKNKISFSPRSESDILDIQSDIHLRYRDIGGDQTKGVIQDMLGNDSDSFMISEFDFIC